MEKMKFETLGTIPLRIAQIERIVPNCIRETKDNNGNYTKTIDFDVLKQELSGLYIEGEETYDFTWVGKKAAKNESQKPSRMTLRPLKNISDEWDETENLYIEGDNLEVLKLLQNSYFSSIKLIYIDIKTPKIIQLQVSSECLPLAG